MNKKTSMMALVATAMMSFVVGCGTAPRAEPESPVGISAKFGGVRKAAEEKVSVDPKVSKTCEGNGGECLASGTWDLTKRAGSWIKDQVTSEENQQSVKDAWKTATEKGGEAIDAVKEKMK